MQIIRQLFKTCSSKEKESLWAIKLYKKLWKTMLSDVSVGDLVARLVSLFFKDGKPFDCIEINYGEKEYYSIQSLLLDEKRLSSRKVNHISCLNSRSGEEIVISFYKKGEEYGSVLLEVILVSSSLNLIEVSGSIRIAKDLVSVASWDYAYGFMVSKRVDVHTESKIRKGLFSTTVSVTKTHIERMKKLHSVHLGYVPQLYPFNMLNKKQMENMPSESKLYRQYCLDSRLYVLLCNQCL